MLNSSEYANHGREIEEKRKPAAGPATNSDDYCPMNWSSQASTSFFTNS